MNRPLNGDSSPVSGAADLFQILRDGHPRTRAELIEVSGLSRSTVTARLESLLELGIVGPTRTAASTGGRPPTQVSLRHDARLVVAADFGATHGRMALTDLLGSTITTRETRLAIGDGPEPTLRWLIGSIDAALSEIGRARTDIISVGMGLPGPVEFSTGRPAKPPIMPGWDGFDVPRSIRREIDCHVLVDNDVNVAAIGEREFYWPTVEHLLFVKIATGIGAGIISGGILQRGAQGTAGDLGHVHVATAGEVACTCGNTGCLEAVASGAAIAQQLRELGRTTTTTDDVVALINQNDLDAIQTVRSAGRAIGEVLATCVSLINPSVITLGGSMARAGEHLLAGVREVVYSRCTPLTTAHLTIAQSRAGVSAALKGAAQLAIDHALSPASVTEMFQDAAG